MTSSCVELTNLSRTCDNVSFESYQYGTGALFACLDSLSKLDLDVTQRWQVESYLLDHD